VADADQLLTDLGRTPGQAGGQQVPHFDQGRQGQTPQAKPGEAGLAEAQKRYGGQTRSAQRAGKTT
jgi:hypothetical protein